ncbi:hypothetical protein SAMN05216439_0830 [Methanobrevibacter gottschalkii]|uniref:Uncharacterized protein n=2 Tax=Methanobrevibacter gottschalkii TaxID=190974 RepID=A0A3N5B5P8_9EURY|nr:MULTISPECIES: hypothetical protein [Methanobrevibacter]MCQ2970101.1 hypothetical protein [archaeon]OEC95055.1 hypothetical protein A9505_00925 [Methanobrevibacter sp. A27]RPF52587.1 hypothetical protein EDC42_0127 [Methanobrevibacter gottschalkii DSM 11977]SEK33006.1 hypothetical protein SAMN05216439_0830 [Methanobrevibacter gottschalkii]
MIEDNIRVLRQAAKVSSNSGYEIEKNWCVIAGNAEIIDKIAYKAIASNHRVKIIFREHVMLNDGKLDKKFDFIMLYGNSIVIDEFKKLADQYGGAYVRILHKYLIEEPNLMVFVAPDNVIKKTVSVIEKSKISFAILQDSQTTAFIDVDLSNEVKLPNFIKSALKPFYNANEVVLSTILISVDKKEEIKKVQSIATSNRIFVIDFKDIVTEDYS